MNNQTILALETIREAAIDRARVVALLSDQGTACHETALYAEENTQANRWKVERLYCTGKPDAPLPGTWTDVTDNDAINSRGR